MDIIPTIVAIGLTLSWIGITSWAQRDLLRKLGRDARTISLYRKSARSVQITLAALAVALPVATVFLSSLDETKAVFMPGELLRSFWLSTMMYGIQRQGTIAVGENGFAFGGYTITPWESLIDIAWDRDIGQREYGFLVRFRRGRSVVSRRMFVLREVKNEVEPILAARLAAR
jgi:hypothetical protein